MLTFNVNYNLTSTPLMDILFSSDALRDICNDTKKAQKKYGKDQARKLRRRLDDLKAATRLEDFRSLPGNCHELKGNRKGQLAINLEGGDRLIFQPAQDPIPEKEDGGLDWKQVTSIRILEIEDYHE